MSYGSSQLEETNVKEDVRAPGTEKEEELRASTTSSSSTTSDLERGEGNVHASHISRIATLHDRRSELDNHAIDLSRMQTARSQHSQTVGTDLGMRKPSRRRTGPPLPMGAGKPHPAPLSDVEEYLVEFDGSDDELHPQNWRWQKKATISLTLTFVTFTATFGSSIPSPAISIIARQFDVSSTVSILGISLYVLGFATGPILWAPLSELYGRKMPLLLSSLGFSIFQLPVAVAKDAQTLLISRFFDGFFGACPLVVVGGVFADMFDNRQRGPALTALSAAVFAGSLLAPLVGGFVVTDIGWRWTHYLTAIMGFAGLLLMGLCLDETYPPVVPVRKAAALRRQTKNWAIHAKQEEIEIDLYELLERNFSRPARMLVTEPIVLMLSIYMAFIYGLLYLFLTFYPIVFQRIYGMAPGVSGLLYLGMLVGEVLAGVYVAIDSPRYNRKLKANNDIPIPEWRLPPAVLGGALFAVGLFWFGWTGYDAEVDWIVPTLSGLCTGFGLLSIFLQCLNYLVDAYLTLPPRPLQQIHSFVPSAAPAFHCLRDN